MSLPYGLEFRTYVRVTSENMAAMQATVLFDLKKGRVPNPELIANPNNQELVDKQEYRVREKPGDYVSVEKYGKLVAFMKLGDARYGDELPFAVGFRRLGLTIRGLLSGRRSPLRRTSLRVSSRTGRWEIFGIGLAEDLSDDERKAIVNQFLEHAIRRACDAGDREIGIVLYQNDALIGNVFAHGFRPFGKRGEAPGVPGILQMRYRVRL